MSFLISELERRKSNLTTQLVWIGAQKEPGVISRIWKWVDGKQNLTYIIPTVGVKDYEYLFEFFLWQSRIFFP